MATTTHIHGGAGVESGVPGRVRRGGPLAWARAHPWQVLLACVSACYAAAQLVIVTPRMGLGWDEIVYVSQVAPVPATSFTAPRARGVSVLVAPVAAFTTSLTVLRVYLSVLSGLGLFVSFHTWLRVRNGPLVPLAAFLFASLWLSLFYGNEAMPNLYVAFGAVAAVGFFLQSVGREDARWPLLGLGVSLAFTALVRPSDSLWLALPLGLGALLVPHWWRGRRRVWPLATIAGGLVAGWAEWVIEAYTRFGGPLQRLHAASAENVGGFHVTLLEHARSLNGPLLCRPIVTDDCGAYPLAGLLWWFATPPLVALGLAAAARARALSTQVLAISSGVSLAVPYLFLIGYAAPRFLLPTYALLALPVAEGVVWLLRGPPRPYRYVTAGLACAGLLTQVLLQGHTLTALVPKYIAGRDLDTRAARDLRDLGVQPPCLVFGHRAVNVAYPMGCASTAVFTRFGGERPPPSIRTALADGRRVVVSVRGESTPAAYLRHWKRVPLRGLDGWYAYFPPGEPPSVRTAGPL